MPVSISWIKETSAVIVGSVIDNRNNREAKDSLIFLYKRQHLTNMTL